MVQSPSWAADWFAASQEIPRISRNPKVHYRTHKRPHILLHYNWKFRNSLRDFQTLNKKLEFRPTDAIGLSTKASYNQIVILYRSTELLDQEQSQVWWRGTVFCRSNCHFLWLQPQNSPVLHPTDRSFSWLFNSASNAAWRTWIRSSNWKGRNDANVYKQLCWSISYKSNCQQESYWNIFHEGSWTNKLLWLHPSCPAWEQMYSTWQQQSFPTEYTRSQQACSCGRQ